MHKEQYWLSEESIKKLSPQSVDAIRTALSHASANDSTILLDVSPDTPDENIATYVILLGLAQYNDAWISNIATHGIDLEFTDVDGNLIPTQQWVTHPQILAWFTRLRNHCPCSLPFLTKWESCFLTAASDIIGELEPEEIEWHQETGGAIFHLSQMENEKIFNRVMLHSEQFFEYCYQTGVDPEPHVLELVKKFNYDTAIGQIRLSWEQNRQGRDNDISL